VSTFLVPPPPPGLKPGPVPSFSVVIATYQAAATIGETLESALDQTLPPHEIVVVDDGSTDETEAVLAPYRERILFIRKKNGGRGSALNVGVRAASGELVSFLDADDIYEPERLEALAELAVARPDLDLLMTDAYIEVGGRDTGRFSEETPFATEQQRLAILQRCFLVCPCVRRRPFLAASGFDESLRIGQDWDCWIRLILAGARAGLVDVPLYRYRIRSDSVTGDRSAALWARVHLLQKAAKNPGLSAEERAGLEKSVDSHRRRALLAEAEAALRSNAPEARRRALAVAASSGFGPRTRLKAACAAIAPRLAGRRLDSHEAKTGWSRLQRGYPRG
jgi:glycosyltransferase involved in cell wall biosynthesis